MAFRKWVLTQDWEGKQLDKDLIIEGNKVYRPEACVFVSNELNSFNTDRAADRGKWPIGVRQHKSGRFISRCSNPFNKEFEYLGMFDTPEEAHMAWKIRKHEHSLTWSSKVDDPRLKQALQTRYKPY
jgi:hypothetical protein